MIAMHNFMKHFPLPKENEFIFHADRFFDFISILLDEPENVIRGALSFFGHFGVQIFIFLSAYGLTRKYSQHKMVYLPFILERAAKILPAFMLSILAWMFVVGWFNGGLGLSGPFQLVDLYSASLLFKFLFFIPAQPFDPVGPWWFIPFIFQFYFIFPLLLYLYSRWGWRSLFTISMGSILFSLALQGGIGNINFYTTVFGHLPELCLGIYLAKNESVEQRIPPIFFVVIVAIFLLGNIYQLLWYTSHLSFLLILLVAFKYIVSRIRTVKTVQKIILYLGNISMPLFLVHGFLAEPFITWAREYNQWLMTIALCLISVSISIAMAQVLSVTEKHLRKKLHRAV